MWRAVSYKTGNQPKPTHNHPKPTKTTHNHQQLPKTTYNQMVWNCHISDRKIFFSFYVILQFLENNLPNWFRYF